MTLSLPTEEVSQVNGLQQIFHPVVDFLFSAARNAITKACAE